MQKIPSKLSIKTFILICVILLILSSTMGCFTNDDKNKDDKRKGFDIDSLSGSAPLSNDLEQSTIDPKPIINTSNPKRISEIIAIWFFEKNAVYKDYGSTINIRIKNNSTYKIYIYKIGIKPEWYSNRLGKDKGSYADVGKYINPGFEEYIGMVQFTGPATIGNYDYNLVFSIYQENATGSWNDFGIQEASSKTINVIDLPTSVDYKQHYNLKQYYDKINSIVNPTNHDVYNLSHEIAGDFSGAYNIYQVCVLFDYVSEHIKYFTDPSNTENYWCTPGQTIKIGGDCEDHSTLLASLIISIGGAVRMYMTDSHAFLGLYLGDQSNIDNITKAIQSYYRTNVNLFYLKDNLGCWLIVDSIGSLYLGGLPLGGVPVNDGISGEGWSWGFTETENFYITDVIPK